MKAEIQRVYGNQVRVRICGLCWKDDTLLLVNHKGLTDGEFWSPPGGGLQFGETAEKRLRQEFMEETGLHVSVDGFQFACEFIATPLHAIELFFRVTIKEGILTKGRDPELNIIHDVRFMSAQELTALPRNSIHGIFAKLNGLEDLRQLNGFFRI